MTTCRDEPIIRTFPRHDRTRLLSSLLLDLRTLPLPGLLKGYLWRVNVRFLAWNPNVDGPSKNPVLCDGGRIRTAEHVFQQLERSFGDEA